MTAYEMRINDWISDVCSSDLGAPILASDTCALDILGADFVRDVEPGELIVIDEDGIHSLHPFPKVPHRFCIFEYIYFARPDSQDEGLSVYEARKRIGAELARSEERREGKECGRTCRYRWSPTT